LKFPVSLRANNTRKAKLNTVKSICAFWGGRCLSRRYINSYTHLEFKCKVKSHPKWPAIPKTITRGSWCTHCSKERTAKKLRGYTIDDMHQIARERGGACLSKVYQNYDSKLMWQCLHLHEPFPKSLGGIKSGSWCPRCSISIGQAVMHQCIEDMFNKKFEVNHYPTWLLNDKGSRLELDAFNHSLKLAFEHQGYQHNVDSRVKKNDRVKKQLCKKKGVTLIEVSQLGFRGIPFKEAYQYIHSLLPKKVQRSAKLKSKRTTDKLVNLALKNRCIEQYDRLVRAAKKRQGKVLSPNYLGSHVKHEWKCKFKSHPSWTAVPYSIIKPNGTWCPECAKPKIQAAADRKKLDIGIFHEIAKKRGGKCLSGLYVDANTRLEFKCKKRKHPPWHAFPYSIKKGTWCKKCHDEKNAENQRCTIEQMQALAKKKEGRCLSKKYVNAGTKLKWSCVIKNHRPWTATPEKIKIGRWCPECRKAVAAMKTKLNGRHGKIGEIHLTYFRGQDKIYKFTCNKGHTFRKKWQSVMSGNWCKKC